MSLLLTSTKAATANSDTNFIDFEYLSIVIPLIVLVVTLLYNLGKEKRDRDYQHRVVVDMVQVRSINYSRTSGDKYIFLDESVFKNYNDLNELVIIVNITKNPLLNLKVEYQYFANGREIKKKYHRNIINGTNSIFIPVRNKQQKNEKRDNEKIVIKYSSLSGQKYKAVLDKGIGTTLYVKHLMKYKKLLFNDHDGIGKVNKI